MTELEDRIKKGDLIILDGGTGSELERRGIALTRQTWSAAGLLNRSDLVQEIHRDYIAAGADVIITNTFATCRHWLDASGLGDRTRELNEAAVTAAQEARRESEADRDVWIAGSISTNWPRRDGYKGPSETQAKANYREQSEILAEGGVDLIALEMMRDIEQTGFALEAALATDLPVWVGFSCGAKEGEDVRLGGYDGETHLLSEGLKLLEDKGVALVAIMHTIAQETMPALQVVKEQWGGPVGAYPHTGSSSWDSGYQRGTVSPEDFLDAARQWVSMGVQAVGGCCGIGPEHIRLLREGLL
ncbi:MAG: homocysteine S-methyltransferase [Chloroflexi bacterium]|jgi:S-methylmethionine-dependent homocysteine/selenocysteine methylase|nr:MAG: homocysteine S-methyltransferase [Chloroflexota bacterium]